MFHGQSHCSTEGFVIALCHYCSFADDLQEAFMAGIKMTHVHDLPFSVRWVGACDCIFLVFMARQKGKAADYGQSVVNTIDPQYPLTFGKQSI